MKERESWCKNEGKEEKEGEAEIKIKKLGEEEEEGERFKFSKVRPKSLSV